MKARQLSTYTLYGNNRAITEKFPCTTNGFIWHHFGTIKDIHLRPPNFDINIEVMIQETAVSVAEMQVFKSPPPPRR